LHDPTPELYRTKFDLEPDSFAIRFLEWVEKLSIGFADLAFTPNIAFKEIFVQRGCPPAKMVIVMNSPQTEIFERAAARALPGPRVKGEFRLMFHGSLLERHGLDDLLHAVALLRSEIPGIMLDIYGARTPYVHQIEALISSLGLGSCVGYHGQQTLEQIAFHILKSDVGIIPNKRTPFTEVNMPTRIFEYLSLQRPVIAPRTKGIGDYFQEHQILYFEPGNIRDLTARIRWAYENPGELRAVTNQGRTIFNAFDWEAQKLVLLSAVESLLSVKCREPADSLGATRW
jgi:glycosyltransferase involved in cell wall biosynthesis